MTFLWNAPFVDVSGLFVKRFTELMHAVIGFEFKETFGEWID